MKSVSVRTVQHQLAAMLSEVEKGEEVVITKHRRPIARLTAVTQSSAVTASPAALKRYWAERPAPPAVRSAVTHADLVAEGRGEV